MHFTVPTQTTIHNTELIIHVLIHGVPVVVRLNASPQMSPCDVIVGLGRAVLVGERYDGFSAVVELVEGVCKHRFLPVVVEEGVPAPQLVVLLHTAIEQRVDACVVTEHKTRYLVLVLDIGRLFREGNLNTGRTPSDEFNEILLPDSLQTFVYLRRIDFTLNYV